MIYLVNAFSINMIDTNTTPNVMVNIVKDNTLPEQIKTLGYSGDADIASYIGHQSTADILSNILGFPIKVNRGNVTLDVDDTAIVAQYVGPRLEEGVTTLPEGSTINWFKVTIVTP